MEYEEHQDHKDEAAVERQDRLDKLAEELTTVLKRHGFAYTGRDVDTPDGTETIFAGTDGEVGIRISEAGDDD